MRKLSKEELFIIVLLAIVLAKGLLNFFVPSIFIWIEGPIQNINQVNFMFGLTMVNGEIYYDGTILLFVTLPSLVVLNGSIVLIVAIILFVRKNSSIVPTLCVVGGGLLISGSIICNVSLSLYNIVELGGVYISFGSGIISNIMIYAIPIIIAIYLKKR